MANLKSFKDFTDSRRIRDKVLNTKGSLKKGRTITGEKPTEVNLEPKIVRKNHSDSIYEFHRAGNTPRTCVFSFGRLNPITIGHEKLANKIISLAEYIGPTADAKLFISRTQGDKKNPLKYSDKLKFARYAFGSIVQNTPPSMLPAGFLGILKRLENKYNKVIIVVGSDRIADIKRLVDRYNHKEYSFEDIQVVSAGERDPDAEGAAGMSASKMRAAAVAGDFAAFKSGLPTKLRRTARMVYNAVREELLEDFESEEDKEFLDEAKKKRKKARPKPKGAKKLRVLTLQQRLRRRMAFRRMRGKIRVGRRRAMRMRASQPKLKRRARRMAIRMLRRRFSGGRNYADMGFSQRAVIDRLVQRRIKAVGRMAMRILPKLRAAETKRKMGGGFKSVSLVPVIKKPPVTVKQHAKQFKAPKPSSLQRILKKPVVTESTELLSEGIYDQGLFKVVFMAGGPGSGKTLTTELTAMSWMGLRMVSSDIPFEYMMRKAGLSLKMSPEDQPQRDVIRGKAKILNQKRFDMYLDGRAGMIIDGTGHDTSAILKMKKLMEALGYETSMLFVYTDLETAQQRNQARDRIVPADVLKDRWHAVVKNLMTFKKMFGRMFLNVNNSAKADYSAEVSKAHRKLMTWTKSASDKPAAVEWMKVQRKLRGLKEDYISEENLVSQVNRILDTIAEFNNIEIPAEYLQEKADKTDFDREILEQVFKRGLCTWNQTADKTPTEQAMLRVNSFIADGLARQMDMDLYEAACKSGAGEVGTDELANTYLKDTPHSGKSTNKKINLSNIVKEEVDVLRKIRYLMNKKNYNQAKDILVALVRRKQKEGKSGTHSIEYYAQKISSGYSGSLNMKVLVDLANKELKG